MTQPRFDQSGKGSNPGPVTSAEESFGSKLVRRWEGSLFLCVGLDAQADRLPSGLSHLGPEEGLFEFNRGIIEATAPYAAAFKPNLAFYEQSGPPGLTALRRTGDWLRSRHPQIPILIDAKRGDLASTNEAYATAVFSYYGADATTVQPFLGAESLAPFLNRADKGVFVLCRTSNPGGGELQNLSVGPAAEPLYLHIARLAAGPEWNRQGNVGLVAGATYPQELGLIREAAPGLPLLIPGIGTQGGDLEAVLTNGLDADGAGVLINASRSIIYASSGPDWASAAGLEAARLATALREGRDRVMEARRKYT